MSDTWTPDPAKRRIVCSAVLLEDQRGRCFKLIGPRHWDATMHAQLRQICCDTFTAAPEDAWPRILNAKFKMDEQVQGFIDQFGDFWDRKEALVIARRHNQIKPKGKSGNPDSDELFSEDLY